MIHFERPFTSSTAGSRKLSSTLPSTRERFVPFLVKYGIAYKKVLLVPKTQHNTTIMGYSQKTAIATTVQESIASDLATHASENKQLIEDLLVFPTTKEQKDSQDNAEDNSDESSDEYHELYLQREGMQFISPILFQDGMDYVECEYYYASIQQQSAKRKRSSRQKVVSPISYKRALQEETPGKLASCIRRNKNKQMRSAPSNEKEPIAEDRAVRRYSFSGMPQLSLEIPTMTRSQSWQHLSDLSQHRGVGFEQHVRVVTIHQAMDYPEDVRRSMWMSREEMAGNMRRAMRQSQRQERPQHNSRLSEEQTLAAKRRARPSSTSSSSKSRTKIQTK
jgi:hypothetical protein